MQVQSPKLIKNVHIYSESKIIEGFLLINSGKIVKIAAGTPDTITIKNSEEVIDGKGGLLLPGFVDIHVHFRDLEQAQKETLETGSLAALSGGVTTVFAMPNTQPPLSNPKAIEQYRNLPRKLYCNIGLYANVTKGFSPTQLSELVNLGIYGLKIYPGGTSSELPLEWDDQWKQFGNIDRLATESEKFLTKVPHSYENWKNLLQLAKKFDLPLLFHPELPYTNDEMDLKFKQILNDEKSFRNVKNHQLIAHNLIHNLAHNENAHLEMIMAFICNSFPNPQDSPKIHFCHLSSVTSLNFLSSYRKKGYPISFEVTPHHMLLNHSTTFQKEGYAKVLNPLRSPIEQQKMWERVQDGKIDLIATDHAPHTLEEKSQMFNLVPSGFPSVDVASRILLTNVFDFQLAMDKFVHYYSTRPAELFGLSHKGKIAPLYDADLVLVEKIPPVPLKASESKSLAKWSPYEGMKLKAKIAKVWLNGDLVFDNDSNLCIPKGKFITRMNL
jgi:dihydroorotase-like cyclic amidohydrolase